MKRHIPKAQLRNARTTRTSATKANRLNGGALLAAMDEDGANLSQWGGQFAASVGTSTTHHRHPFDFSIGLKRAGELYLLAEFERERRALAGTQDGQVW